MHQGIAGIFLAVGKSLGKGAAGGRERDHRVDTRARRELEGNTARFGMKHDDFEMHNGNISLETCFIEPLKKAFF